MVSYADFGECHLAGSGRFGLPGSGLTVISTCLFAWWRWGDDLFSIYILVTIAALAAMREWAEFYAVVIGFKSPAEINEAITRINRALAEIA